MGNEERISPEQVVLQYKVARRDRNTDAGDELIRKVIQQTREHAPEHAPEFSYRLEKLVQDVGIQGIFDMAETWGDLTTRIASLPRAIPQETPERIGLRLPMYLVGLAVAATAGLLAGGALFSKVQVVEVPRQQVSIDSPYAIKRSPSGRTLYQIIGQYIDKRVPLADIDFKEIVALTSGRYVPISQKFGKDGLYLKIWNPDKPFENEGQPIQDSARRLYEQTRGNLGRSQVPSTTLADALNRAVYMDDESTIKKIVANFVKRNYGVDIKPEDIVTERTKSNLLHDVKYVPKGKPQQTTFSTENGHILFLGNHTLFIPYEAMKENISSMTIPDRGSTHYFNNTSIPTHNLRNVAKLPDYVRAKHYQARMRG